MTAEIVYLPRLDLPEPPKGTPVYYVAGDCIDGLGSIYLHTPQNTWWKGGRPIPATEVPVGLKRLGVES